MVGEVGSWEDGFGNLGSSGGGVEINTRVLLSWGLQVSQIANHVNSTEVQQLFT